MATETQIIAALANECRLELAQCDGESPGGRRCLRHRGHVGKCYCGVWWNASGREDPPTLEAWQAEWAAERPGEPGPVRDWLSEDGRTWWFVNEFGVGIRVGKSFATRRLQATDWEVCCERCTSADVADLARLMAAADKAGV